MTPVACLPVVPSHPVLVSSVPASCRKRRTDTRARGFNESEGGLEREEGPAGRVGLPEESVRDAGRFGDSVPPVPPVG